VPRDCSAAGKDTTVETITARATRILINIANG
jgi:hypothetical protein